MTTTSKTDTERSRLQALIELSARALRASSFEQLAVPAVRAVAAASGVQRVGVFELGGRDEPQVLLRWGVGWRGDQIGTLTVPADAVLSADGPVEHGDPGSGRVEPLLAIGMIRGITIPIPVDGGAYGVLGCFTDDLDRTFAPELVGFVGAVGELLGAAVQRIKMEESLRGSARRLAMAQRIANMGSYDWHIGSDTNVWSDELYRIYGTEPQSFNPSYQRFLSFVHPDDRERVVATHRRALENREPYELEERIIRPNGEIRILETNGEVVTDEVGNPVRMVGICFDVTEQRAAAEAARRYEVMRHDRRHALEINDNVVQGLATIIYALERKRIDLALAAADRTLASVRDMVSELLVESSEEPIGPGSLRRGQTPPSALPKEEQLAVDLTAGAIKVLIADDSEDLRLMLRMALLGAGGFEIVGEAEDGPMAIKMAEETQPDVVLLDLAMPQMDGLEVARELRARGSAAKIVVMSGFDAGTMARAAEEQGATLYLEKGRSIKDIAASIMSLFPEGNGSAAG